MSKVAASSEHAPSKPQVTSYTLARMGQKTIQDLHTKANVEAGCIRQLMVGRHVRRIGETRIYLVTEIRFDKGWIVQLYGRARPLKRGRSLIGTLAEVEVVEPGSET